jgi:hypothetical protein
MGRGDIVLLLVKKHKADLLHSDMMVYAIKGYNTLATESLPEDPGLSASAADRTPCFNDHNRKGA